MRIRRGWAMPNKFSFQIEPIGELVEKYCARAQVIIDPFAGSNRKATHTNDLNPFYNTDHNLDALAFLQMLEAQDISADAILFDPPYSLQQIKEVYKSIGIERWTKQDQQNQWRKEKDICAKLLKVGGHFLHFGWHTNALGKKRNCQIVEILMVAHGRTHHDTLCTVERKIK